jgi:TRAP-type C4-dicarboxylate transport system permease small subunit
MKAFEENFVRFNKVLVALILAAVFTIVFANVVGRYVLGSSFAWGEEAARHLMILGAFCGAGLALREGRLVAIETLAERLPENMSRLLRWAGVVVMFCFMAMVLWLGIRFVGFGWSKETMSTGMSRGIPYLAIPIGSALFLIHCALFARRYVAQEFEIDEVSDIDGEVG